MKRFRITYEDRRNPQVVEAWDVSEAIAEGQRRRVVAIASVVEVDFAEPSEVGS